MTKTIVWFRNDLRIHDHPALHAAAGKDVLPVFLLDQTLLTSGRHSANRNRFLIESLKDLRESLKSIGSNLIILDGDVQTLIDFSKKHDVTKIHYSIDYTPYARKRDAAVKQLCDDASIDFVGYPGRLAVDSVKDIVTKSSQAYKVFTPFYRNWSEVSRRDVLPAPKQLSAVPQSVAIGSLPTLKDVADDLHLSPDAAAGGESTARRRMKDFLDNDVTSYINNQNDLGVDGTSRLSSYLHFGCLSVRELEAQLTDADNQAAFRRQLAWRDFYHYVLLHYPDNTKQEFQERYRGRAWTENEDLLKAWQDAKTGYPIVDAAMTQLHKEGWMHNRARLIVGSFLTKDLGIDWRSGEDHFLRWLTDGDMANNNGNWQWIASVGVDPAPVFRRLYNPSSQQEKYDPDGNYVRRYLPVFKDVPTKYLGKPWEMTDDQQAEYGVQIGKDYPQPVVDHTQARQRALEWYRAN
ncbi:MAG: deoxyribodipyrimidine photo-lyase [Chloroflexi bacterium]|nr:MAG: deoxyribodipyrimidine photo-lyase [Chloroflexota bacterium]